MGKRKSSTKEGESTKRRKTNTVMDKITEPRVTRSMHKALAVIQDVEHSSQEQELNPLLIDHILDKVFHYVFGTEPTKVKDVRLVCKQWNEAATRLFRRRRGPLGFGNVHNFIPKQFDSKMETFLNVMSTSSLIPVQRYILGANFFIKANQKLMKDFIRICGPEAVELRLNFDNCNTMNFNRRSFPDLNLLKLRTLHVHCDSFKGRTFTSQSNDIPYLVEVLLGGAKILQEFRFDMAPRDVKWQPTIVKRFSEVICNFVPKTVKILRLDISMLGDHIRKLAEADLKLEEFQLDCSAVVERSVITAFLEMQSPTLRILKVVDDAITTSIPLELPTLDNLEQMEFTGANIKPFSYADKFPKLDTLNLTEWKTESSVVEMISHPKKVHSVTEIYLPFRFPQAPLIKKVAQNFPNIRKVHITPSPDIVDSLQEAFIHFSEIEELYVSFPFLLDNELNADSIFSGVSELDCRRIMRHRDFETVNVKDVQKKPSITNLKKLKKLVLDDTACDVILTDFAVHFVFMKMESLVELHTSRFRISSRYVDLLRNKLKLKLVEDDYSEYESDGSDDGWSSDSSMIDDVDGDFQFFPHFLGVGEVAFNIFLVRWF